MKILYLYHFKPHSNYDHYLNIDFANIMACYPGLDVMGYGLGLGLTESYSNFAPLKYSPTILLSDIYKIFKFDVIMVNTKGRCFEYYDPHNKIDSGTWFPKDFSTWNLCPKISTEEDYHYETDDKWYQTMGFNLILQRHYSQSLREEVVPMKFFPFSVDVATFNSWGTECIHKNTVLKLTHQKHRIKKIAFVGHDQDKA